MQSAANIPTKTVCTHMSIFMNFVLLVSCEQLLFQLVSLTTLFLQLMIEINTEILEDWMANKQIAQNFRQEDLFVLFFWIESYRVQ